MAAGQRLATVRSCYPREAGRTREEVGPGAQVSGHQQGLETWWGPASESQSLGGDTALAGVLPGSSLPPIPLPHQVAIAWAQGEVSWHGNPVTQPVIEPLRSASGGAHAWT